MDPVFLNTFVVKNEINKKKSCKSKADNDIIHNELNTTFSCTTNTDNEAEKEISIIPDVDVTDSLCELDAFSRIKNVEKSKNLEPELNDVEMKPIADVVEAFKCKDCDFLTCDKSAMISHCQNLCNKQSVTEVKTEVEKTMYICGKCSIPLSSVEECRRHMMINHNLQEITTDNEEKLNTDKNNRKDNQSIRISKAVEEYWSQPRTKQEAQAVLCGDRKIKCTMKQCLYRFNSEESMETHRACHVDVIPTTTTTYQRSPQRNPTPPYLCSICKISCNNWPTCSLHLWREHQIFLDILSCPLCSAVKTHSVSKMVQHLARHWRNVQKNKNGTKNNVEPAKEESDQTPNLPRWYAKMQCEICNKVSNLYIECFEEECHMQKRFNLLRIKP